MFLRYKNTHKAVNLDNFDFIKIDSNSCAKKYEVVACKLFSRVTTTTMGLCGSDVSSGGKVSYVIKDFPSEDEAIAFYEKLQYAWINKLDIFEVD